MPSKAQIDLFEKLLSEKDFGNQDVTVLAAEFLKLNMKSASAWIERALALPKRDESGETVVAPTF